MRVTTTIAVITAGVLAVSLRAPLAAPQSARLDRLGEMRLGPRLLQRLAHKQPARNQLVLIAVGYGKVRPSSLDARPAALAHRAAGDAIVVIVAVVAVMCISYFGFGDDEALHFVAGTALLAALALKIAVIRRWHSLGRFLPLLGITVFGLLVLTWLTSAGPFLAGQ